MTIHFEIPGMTCGGCARSITTAIQGLDAQATVATDIPGRRISVDSRVDSVSLIAAIREAGYDAQAV